MCLRAPGQGAAARGEPLLAGLRLLHSQRTCNFYFFFFSSRRRHTRCSRDWSSDVCSSDLATKKSIYRPAIVGPVTLTSQWLELKPTEPLAVVRDWQEVAVFPNPPIKMVDRSEERRVGKECRSRWSPYH